MKKSPLGLALCLIALSQSSLAALGDPGGTAAGNGVTNYGTVDPTLPATTTAPPPATSQPVGGNPDKWPWMEKGKSDSSATPAGSTFKPETPQAAPVSSASTKPAAAEPKKESAAAAPKRQSNQPMRLFGRIEEISGHSGASFPALQAMTPKMDPRGVAPKRAAVAQSTYSGTLVKSFPPAYSGTWGGNLQVQQEQIDRAYYSYDPEEAQRTAQAMKVGMMGAVNFSFQNLGTNKVALEPAEVMFMVPGSDTSAGDQISAMFGGSGMQNSPMGAMMKQMANQMQVPLMMHFGQASTFGHAGETSLSGEQYQSTLLKNDIRQLEPGVLEQQIVTKHVYYAKNTGQPRTGYGETVIRFIWRGPTQMYVQAASVDYNSGKQFLTKTVLGGYITKGQVMQTNPMAGMGNMQQMMNVPGLGAPNGGAIPGIDPNMMKQIFGGGQ